MNCLHANITHPCVSNFVSLRTCCNYCCLMIYYGRDLPPQFHYVTYFHLHTFTFHIFILTQCNYLIPSTRRFQHLMTQIMQYWITTIQQLREVYYLKLAFKLCAIFVLWEFHHGWSFVLVFWLHLLEAHFLAAFCALDHNFPSCMPSNAGCPSLLCFIQEKLRVHNCLELLLLH